MMQSRTVDDDEKIEFLEFVVEEPANVPLYTYSPLQEIDNGTNVSLANGFDPYYHRTFREQKEKFPLMIPRGPLILPLKDDVLVEQFQPLKKSLKQSHYEPPKQARARPTRKRKFVAKRTNFDKGSRSKSETGYRGVRFSTNGCRFRSTVNVNKKPFNVGTFDTAQLAAEEYDKALIRITNGKVERSRLNFPHKWNDIYDEVRESNQEDDGLPPSKRRKTSTKNGWSRFAQA